MDNHDIYIYIYREIEREREKEKTVDITMVDINGYDDTIHDITMILTSLIHYRYRPKEDDIT